MQVDIPGICKIHDALGHMILSTTHQPMQRNEYSCVCLRVPFAFKTLTANMYTVHRPHYVRF